MRECSTGGGAATRVAPAVSFHLTGHPGDLKFPGRSAQYLPIQPAFVCLIEILLILGNKNGGTPALLLPDDKGRRRGGEQPEQAELRGGWRCEGGGDFSSRMPGDDCNQFALYAIGWRLDLFSETYTFNCSREERESDQVNLADRGTIFGVFSCIQRHHFHFYLLLVLSFIMGCLQYLMRGRLTRKCSCNKYSDVKTAFESSQDI